MAGRSQVLCLIATLGMIGGVAAVAVAQVVPKPQPKAFRPARPTFSPYFELTRPLSDSPGRLPQYYTFYQRNLQYQADIQRQSEINRQSQATIQSLQQNLRAVTPTTGTGQGSSFGTYGGYFGTHGSYFRTR